MFILNWIAGCWSGGERGMVDEEDIWWSSSWLYLHPRATPFQSPSSLKLFFFNKFCDQCNAILMKLELIFVVCVSYLYRFRNSYKFEYNLYRNMDWKKSYTLVASRFHLWKNDDHITPLMLWLRSSLGGMFWKESESGHWIWICRNWMLPWFWLGENGMEFNKNDMRRIEFHAF